MRRDSVDLRDRLRRALDCIRPRTNATYAARLPAIDVASIRVRLGMTQEQFAARFGFPVATLRHWERGDRRPQGAALVLLAVIDDEPRAVLRALAKFNPP
jgi:putative transcriptional regulator